MDLNPGFTISLCMNNLLSSHSLSINGLNTLTSQDCFEDGEVCI